VAEKRLIWVRPKGQAPRPGTTLHVVLEQNVDGRQLHTVGEAEVFEGGRALLKITQASSAGRVAGALMADDMLDAVFWGSRPTVRLRE
jgi:hypothetical protein